MDPPSRSSYFAAVGWALGLLSAASVTTIVILAAFSLRRLAFLIAALVPPRRDELLAEELLPPLAVVVPAHNERTTLQALFGSLERLEYPRDRLSVVLVDDGSTDTTARLLHDWAHENGWVRVVGLGRRRGKGRALNAGLAASDAELVAVFDADIRPRPDCLSRLVSAVARGEAAAAARIVPANASASLVARYSALETSVHQLVTSAAKDRLALDPPTLGASIYRRSSLQSVGRFRVDSVGEDVDASLALSRAGLRTRFVAGARAETSVVETVADYWRQHLRWARGTFDAARGRPSPASRPLRVTLEAWAVRLGYTDRVAFLTAVVFAATGHIPAFVLGGYLLLPASHVVLALAKARVGPLEAAKYVLAAGVVFPLDVAASFGASLAQLSGRTASWQSPRPADAGQAT